MRTANQSTLFDLPNQAEKTAPADRTALPTFSLDRGKVFVAGLFWQSVQQDNTDAKKQIKKLGAELAFDLFVQRTTTGTPQAGFASSTKGFTEGMLSAAALMSKTIHVDRLGRNVLIALALGDGRWLYFAQNEGATLPDGDRIGTEDDIKNLVLANLALDVAYDTIIAPVHWGIDRSQERAFDSFFPRSPNKRKNIYKTWWALQPITPRYFSRRYLLPCVVVALTLAAVFATRHWLAANRLAQQQQQQQRVIEQEALAAARIPPPPVLIIEPVHPWKSLPRALVFATACNDAIRTLPSLFPAGWSFREATCIGNALVVVWMRPANGRVDFLREMEPRAVFSDNFASASVSIALQFKEETEEALLPNGIRSIALADMAQKFDLRINLGVPAQPQIPSPTPNNAAQTMPAPWTVQTWSIATLDQPLLTTLSAIDANGFRVTSMQMLLTGGVMIWNLEGMQYAQP
jgi:hypothetical protein